MPSRCRYFLTINILELLSLSFDNVGCWFFTLHTPSRGRSFPCSCLNSKQQDTVVSLKCCLLHVRRTDLICILVSFTTIMQMLHASKIGLITASSTYSAFISQKSCRRKEQINGRSKFQSSIGEVLFFGVDIELAFEISNCYAGGPNKKNHVDYSSRLI